LEQPAGVEWDEEQAVKVFGHLDLHCEQAQAQQVIAPPDPSTITCLDQDKTAAHDGTAADLVDHLGINRLSQLDTKVFEHPGEQKAVPQIMCPGSCGYRHNMVDHEPRQVDLLPLIHQVSQTLIHGVRLIAPLSMRYYVLDDKPEDQLMERLHIPLLH